MSSLNSSRINEKMARHIKNELEQKERKLSHERYNRNNMCNSVYDRFKLLLTDDAYTSISLRNPFYFYEGSRNFKFIDFEKCDEYTKLKEDLKNSDIEMEKPCRLRRYVNRIFNSSYEDLENVTALLKIKTKGNENQNQTGVGICQKVSIEIKMNDQQ